MLQKHATSKWQHFATNTKAHNVMSPADKLNQNSIFSWPDNQQSYTYRSDILKEFFCPNWKTILNDTK